MPTVMIRPYEEKDAAAISDFMKRRFLSQQAFTARSHEPEYYTWKYRDHGLGTSIVRLAEESGKVVGFFGIMPKRFWIGGSEQPAAEVVEAFIDPDFQGGGVFQKLVAEAFEACGNRFGLYYCSPNDLALPIWTAVYKFRPAFDYVSLVRPVRFDNVPVGPRWTRPILEIAGRIVGWIFDLVTLSGRSPNLSTELAPYPDPSFDEFWARTRSRFDFSLVKNAEYLRWRFFDNPEPFEVYWILRNGERIGWFVLKTNVIRGLRFAHLVDGILPEDRTELRTFAVRLVRLLKNREFDWISTWTPQASPLHSVLKGTGFLARKKSFHLVIRGKTVAIPEGYNDPTRWSFGQADTDNI
jgi:GNAT superfamily N-acetyltransferase